MPGKPAARATDQTSCPKHGDDTNVITSGSPDVLFDGLAAARLGDQCTCGQTLSGGFSSTVLINGRNAMTLDSTTDHGGVIVGGSGTVIIGDVYTPAPVTPPLPAVGQPLVEFIAVSAANEQPIAQQTYAIETIEGRTVKGLTDFQGKTQTIPTLKPDLAIVHWVV